MTETTSGYGAPGHDVLQLSWASFQSFDEVLAASEQVGSDVVITLPPSYPVYDMADAGMTAGTPMDMGADPDDGADPGTDPAIPLYDQVTLVGVDLSQLTAAHVQLV